MNIGGHVGGDDDHLHIFTVDGRHYANPYFDLGDCADQSRATVFDALPRLTVAARPLRLRRLLRQHGHMRKVLDPNAAGPLPICTGGRGAAPIEDLIR